MGEAKQYCYDIEGSKYDVEELKDFIKSLYQNKKISKKDVYGKDEELPLLLIHSPRHKQVCIILNSRAKKVIERIENIHNSLKPSHLQFGDVKLGKPQIVSHEQCKWWEKQKEGCVINEAHKWTTLSHNGPYFDHLAHPYEPHNIPILYDGKKIKLTPEEEKVATLYARRIYQEKSAGTTAIKHLESKVFQNNFFKGFKKYLTPEHRKIITDFSKISFSPIVKYIEDQKSGATELTKQEKNKKKEVAKEIQKIHGFATVNGVVESVGNFRMEPAGLFLGRGANVNRGKIKPDIEPEEVTINIGKGEKIPKLPKGRNWKEIVHDHTAEWLAKWKDHITGKDKYMRIGAKSQFKGKNDYKKYEKARKLNLNIDNLRKIYEKDVNASNKKLKQIATILYFIDHYGIRVGTEKGEDKDNTAVGATTLLVDHVSTKEENVITFDFEGKDTVRYYKKIPVPENIYKNIKKFKKGKKGSELLFDVSANDINKYLKSFDKQFTAKIFRTRLASSIMYEKLYKSKISKKADVFEKSEILNKANAEVAKVLNHVITLTQKAQERAKKLKSELDELKSKKRSSLTEKQLAALKLRIKKKELAVKERENTQTVSLATSKQNYIDPRLYVSWAKKYDYPINSIYSVALRDKFLWAIETTESDWDYEKTPLLAGFSDLVPATEGKGDVPSRQTKRKPGGKKPVEKKEGKKPVEKKKPREKEESVEETSEEKEASEIVNISKDVYGRIYGKSFIVYGKETASESIKRTLKELKGRWNPNLKGEIKKAWVFAMTRRKEVINALKLKEFIEESAEETSEEEKEIPKKETRIRSKRKWNTYSQKFSSKRCQRIYCRSLCAKIWSKFMYSFWGWDSHYKE